jgi:WD40 repeat protein
LAQKATALGVAFSPDGRWLATVSNDNNARILDAGTLKQLRMLWHPDWVERVAFSPDGRRLATASHNNSIARIWDTSSGNELHLLHHGHWVRAVVFSPDGRYLATASGDRSARIEESSNSVDRR